MEALPCETTYRNSGDSKYTRIGCVVVLLYVETYVHM
jgi:hypothetical protein